MSAMNHEDVSGKVTLRDYFAAMAMQGILANPHLVTHTEANGVPYSFNYDIEQYAYQVADQMLRARKEQA